MSADILRISNLNHRPYVHGTSLTRAVLEYFGYPAVVGLNNFDIRLRKVLTTQPLIELSATPPDNVATASATGSIEIAGVPQFFIITASTVPLDAVEQVDEGVIRRASTDMTTPGGLHYRGVCSPPEGLFGALVAWNVIAAETASRYFANQLHNQSQLWLVGTNLPDLSFLTESATHLGVGDAVEHVTPTIIRRKLIWNDRVVGSRVDALAARK